MPGDYQKVRALPGIGPYTAGAICSIAFNLPTPAVDGNVLRVISRLENDATPIDLPACKKAVEEKLRRIYPAEAGDFTQALMELLQRQGGLQAAAEAALRGDPAQLQSMVGRVMGDPAGACVVERITKRASKP